MTGSTTDQSQSMLEAILQSAVGAIITIDPKGLIQSVNRATVSLFGYAEIEMIGQNVKMLMPEPHRTQHDGYLAHHMTTGERKIIGIGRDVEGHGYSLMRARIAWAIASTDGVMAASSVGL